MIALQTRLTLDDIFRLDGILPAAKQQIDRLQYECSRMVLGGDSGVGKTWLEVAASLAVASGQLVWGRFATRQGPVVFYEQEGIRRMTIAAVAQVARGMNLKANEVPFELRFREKVQLHNEAWRLKLIADLKAMDAVRLVFDPIALTAIFNELKPEEWTRYVFEPIDHIIDETGVAVSLSHHANKQSLIESLPPKAALRGSSHLPAWSDTILFAADHNTGGLLLSHAKMRAGPLLGDFNVTISFQDDAVAIVCEDADSTVKRNEMLDAAILEAVAAKPGINQAGLELEAKKRVGGARSETVRLRMRQLVTAGQLEDKGGGGQGRAHSYWPV